MASQCNLLLHTYPMLQRSSTPPSYSMKTSLTASASIPSLRLLTINQRVRSSFSSFQTRKISPRIACSLDATTTIEGGGEEGYDDGVVAKPPPSWVETYLPEKARPYAYLMRLHKFKAAPLITLPCLWSIAFTTPQGSMADVKLLALFSLVGMMNRGIICTVNDILDRDIDAKVKRTTYRPLVCGSVTLFQGTLFLGLQVLLCYCLLLPVNALSRNLWLASLVLSFTYPLMKRLTNLAQVYSGIMINSLNFTSWAAAKGAIDSRILYTLTIASLFWVISFDIIYAHQDKIDDAEMGVKSTAVLMGDSTKTWLTCFGAITMSALVLTGFLAGIGWPYYASLVAAAIHLGRNLITVDLDSPADCFSKFESNVQLGAIVLSGILLGRFYH